jgi:hypothetical protein
VNLLIRALNMMSKHDEDCIRRKINHPLLCTCGLSNEEVNKILEDSKDLTYKDDSPPGQREN